MPGALPDWEKQVARRLEEVEPSSRRTAAVLLPLVPCLTDWDEFKASVKADWITWKRDLLRYRACLLMLYSGLAYYEYDENTFWPQFAEAAGSEPLPANRQQEINSEFAEAAKFFALPVKRRGHGTDFVGSAVHYIGIPLSLWVGFLDICEWALWRRNWKTLSGVDWAEAIDKRAGSRRRLKKFLVDNREIATELIQEILDAREILTANPLLTIDEIKQASILRAEYFEEVPETADFLRPQCPDSLFRSRARLVWNGNRNQICVQLPGIDRDKLPATWQVGTRSQRAATNPDELALDNEAFCSSLSLTLLYGNGGVETQRLRGLGSWGLFDTFSGGRVVNTNRDELPLTSYTLVSQKEIEILSREGFDEAEYPVNERLNLRDGNACFITHLWPTGKRAELRLQESPLRQRIIRFRTRSRIEARFFVGWGRKAAYFTRTGPNEVIMGHLPILCVAIPNGYFSDNKAELARGFKVLVDGKPSAGKWEEINQHAADSQFYHWKWDRRPLLERKPGVSKLSGFHQLTEAYKSVDLGGRRTFTVEALPHIRAEFAAEIVDRTSDTIDSCWKNLPGFEPS